MPATLTYMNNPTYFPALGRSPRALINEAGPFAHALLLQIQAKVADTVRPDYGNPIEEARTRCYVMLQWEGKLADPATFVSEALAFLA